MSLATFAPTAGQFLSATRTSQAAALNTTGSPTTALVVNLGEWPVFVNFGASSAVVASNTSTPVMPGKRVAFTLNSNTFVAVATLQSAVVGVSVVVGS